MATSLVNNLGGSAGFGESFLVRNDDSSTGFIDLRSVFGSQGINFFGVSYTGLYLNNNGNLTFTGPIGTYTPSAITGNTANPLIAAYWADVDTRGSTVTARPGGTSTGSNLAWYDLDPESRTFTATWDDVGYFSIKNDKLNAFQISLTQVGDNGDFDITFRYETVEWTTGDASSGVDGLGGVLARAGYTSGNGVNFFELPQSGNQSALLALEDASNVGIPGTFVFNVRGGSATPAISVVDTVATEGNGTPTRFAIVPVQLAAAASGPVTVQYATADGSALAGQDYVGQRGTLTFAPGVTQQNVFIELIGDTGAEAHETFLLRLSGATGAPLADAEAVVTIANDDGLTISDVSGLEGTSATPSVLAFTVRLLTPTTVPVTVNYATQSGIAIAGTDFTAATGTLTFAPGEIEKTVQVQVTADSISEADETFSVVLSGAVGAAIADSTGLGTILNDDGIVIDDVTVTEGTAATNLSATVTVRLLSPSSTPVTVAYYTELGSATAGSDFVSTIANVTIPAGATQRTINIPIVRDSQVEPDETFTVRITNSNGPAIVDDSATVRILNDDGFSVSDITVTEGNGGTTSATFTVTIGSPLSTTATVNFATVDGTATAGSDYAAVGGLLTFGAGIFSQTVTINIAGDVTPEANETFGVVLSNASANAGIARATATATIFNDDGLRVANATVTESNSGTVTIVVPVTLSAASASTVTVGYALEDGTATGGIDYTPATGVLTFAPGVLTQNISVVVAGDTVFEPDETLRVVLSGATNSAIVDGSGTVTIINDDVRPPPSLRVIDAAVTEGTGTGNSLLRFTVALSEVTDSAVTVAYATSPGTATAASDYVTTSGTLTIPAGSLFGLIEVPVVRDALVEADETFTVTLSNPSSGVTIAAATATGTILNDDARVAIDSFRSPVSEGNVASVPLTFNLSRTGDASGAATVDWAVTGFGANPVNAADFVGGAFPSGTVSFAAGQTSASLVVNVAGDQVVEADESFQLTLSNPSAGVTLGGAIGVVLRNDDATMAISTASAEVVEGQSGATPVTFTVTRSGYTAEAASASWAVTGSGGAAANAADFVGGALPSGVVNFAAGETSRTITVNLAGDTAVEANESFTVTLSNPSAGISFTTAGASRTILNDDSTLAVSGPTASVAEGNAGSTVVSFTVTREGVTSGAATASWAVTGIGANPANAADFAGGVLPSGTVNFVAGQSLATVTVLLAGDRLLEADEGFSLTLSNPTAEIGNISLATASASAIIRNDDTPPPPTLAIRATDADLAEGTGTGVRVFSFEVTRSGDLTGATMVAWSVAGSGGSPANAADFLGGVLPSGTVAFAAGESSQIVKVRVQRDASVEADEGFAVTLSGPSGGTLGTASASGVIRNDDVGEAVLAIRATTGDLVEGTGTGVSVFTYEVTRSGDLSGASSATWRVTGSGTNPANAGDFLGGALPSGSVFFEAGEASQIVKVRVQRDATPEANETFNVALSAPSGATIGTATATGLIRNDDTGAAQLAIRATDASLSEGSGSGVTVFTFEVVRDGDLSGASSATWRVAGSGASPANAADFLGGVLPSGTVAFAAGEASQIVKVRVLRDTITEADEGFTVALSSPNGATLGTASATGLIRNDDAAAPVIAIAADEADRIEGSGSGVSVLTFLATRSGDLSGASQVGWSVAGSGPSPADAADFQGGVLPSGTLSFAAGEASQIVKVRVLRDTNIEANEGFVVNLSAPVGGVLGTASANGIVRNDDFGISSLSLTTEVGDRTEGTGSGVSVFSYIVNRSGDVSGAAQVDWRVTGGGSDPASAEDFLNDVLPAGTVLFDPGVTSQIIKVRVLRDAVPEGNEGFLLTLFAPVGAAIGDGSASGLIRNDDFATTAFSFASELHLLG